MRWHPGIHGSSAASDHSPRPTGWLHIPLAMGVSALFALVTGLICLRTKGVYFIMITMAFAQMVYYLFVSIEEYGADDGLVIYNALDLPLIDLDEPLQLYPVAFVLASPRGHAGLRIVNSRFGMVLQGAKGNEDA
jgi:branched-chain amino acid transport system permease protein